MHAFAFLNAKYWPDPQRRTSSEQGSKICKRLLLSSIRLFELM